MFLKEFMLSLAIAALLEPKEESKFMRERNEMFDEVDRKVDAYRERQRLLSQKQEEYEKPITYYSIYIQEEPSKKNIILSSVNEGEAVFGTSYSDIKKAIAEVKRLKEDYLRCGFKVETHIDLLGEKKIKGECTLIVCPNCHVGVSAKVWDTYTAKIEGYNPDEMMGLSKGELAKHKEFETQYRCPTCHSEIAGATLLA